MDTIECSLSEGFYYVESNMQIGEKTVELLHGRVIKLLTKVDFEKDVGEQRKKR